jgi:tetratricopeptide (TPR) repeat protein
MLGAVAIVIAQSGAWTSGLPPECAQASGRAANVWERAKAPELGHYCDLVASAAAKLVGPGAAPSDAVVAAQQADAVLPGHAAPKALEGRALVALGRTNDAAGCLEEARTRDPRALDDPQSLLAWARVLAHAGHAERALGAYRELLPRSTALPVADRAVAAAEAGIIALSLGPEQVDVATAALREAVRQSQEDTDRVAVLALALALDRAGAVDEARALMLDRPPGDPRTALDGASARQIVDVAPGEAPALVAYGLESIDPASARVAWADYAGTKPEGPWASHARAHAAVLTTRRRGLTRSHP